MISSVAASRPQLAAGWRMWVASAVIMLCSWLSYVDRQVLAVLSPMILRDTHLSVAAYADAIAAFSVAYTLANPLWGSILDRIGLRRGMLIAVGIWTFASVSHAWVAGLLGFAAARAVLGFGEGATFPGGLRTAADSLPPGSRSRGMAIAYSGSTLGAIVTPLLVTPLALAFGWRAAFLLTGGLGALWLILWSSVARPPWLVPSRQTARMLWPRLNEKRFWMLFAGMGLGGAQLGTVLTLSPVYLNRALGMTQAELGNILWAPTLGWGIGYYFWGWVADRTVGGNQRPVRLYTLLAVLSLPLALVTHTDSRFAVLALFFWGMFIAVGFITLSLHVAAHAYPQDQTGMVAGIGSGAWGAIQAAVLPVYGHWFDLKWYDLAWSSMVLLPLAGYAFWLLLTNGADDRVPSSAP
ncbi:MAG TPA: MFS transporter [Bryobacteraceae bacterium]|nr:MFS transporter [Bryobacteraceae bacterium]